MLVILSFWGRARALVSFRYSEFRPSTMAPRGRPRKYRNTRMDAAVEAMTKEYGFSEEDVKRVVKDLLKEYGGEDGWFFIEQYFYKELVEALLRDQEADDQKNPIGQGDPLLGRTAKGNAPADAAGPSGPVTKPACSVDVENKLEKKTKEDVNHLSASEGDGEGWKGIGLDQSSGEREIANAVCDMLEQNTGSSEGHPDNSSELSPIHVIPSIPLDKSVPSQPKNSPIISPLPKIQPVSAPTDTASTRRRMPCYGWIDSDEEDVDDFIELTPAVETSASEKVKSWEYVSCGNKPAKQRSRWDMKPGDP